MPTHALKHPSAKGIYLHIPFCSHLCHYCDFAKTANFGSSDEQSYFQILEAQIQWWLTRESGPYTSVFFGGGTPGLYQAEFAPLLGAMRPHLSPHAEISLEANPNNISNTALNTWRDLGFNRLSIGIQSFDPMGLSFLTRDHSPAESRRAIELALNVIPNFNIDLIYGWQGQTMDSWRHDLKTAVELGVPHLSLYCLTFEYETTLGRKLRRGLVSTSADDTVAEYYEYACAFLKEQGYQHEEVSNWSKPGKSCAHNWLYWRDQPYVGIGAGAHGYLKHGPIGERYAYPKDFRKYLSDQTPTLDSERDRDSWLLEYLGSSLRTCEGTSIAYLEHITQKTFRPSPLLLRAQDEKMLSIGDNIVLSENEWFREAGWAVELSRCFA